MLFENIKEALTSIASNKMRSVLTMLGIIIGISAVITITTIGNSIRSTLNSTLNSLGGNMVSAYVQARYPETDEEYETWVYPDMDEDDYVTDEMIQGLLEAYPEEFKGIAISTFYQTGQIKENSEKYANLSVNGATAEHLEYMKLNFVCGRSLTKADNDGEKNVCVIADTMAKRYFGKTNPLGQMISVDCANGQSLDLVIVGVYEYSNAIFGKEDTTIPEKDRVTCLYAPYNYIQKIAGNEKQGMEYFDLIVDTTADIQLATQHADEYFNENWYADNKDWYIYTYNMQSQLGIIDTVINVVTVAISAIAAISLIVGGVGVMNIMLVSITERTREIGVRMALGAKRKTIRLQFVIEAIVLCIIGGIIGITIGIVNGALLGKVADMIIQSMYSDYAQYIIMSVHPSPKAICLSLFFSMLIGVFFGYYPANKASKMEVIDALRYE